VALVLAALLVLRLLRPAAPLLRALARSARQRSDPAYFDGKRFGRGSAHRAGGIQLRRFLFLLKGFLQPAQGVAARNLQAGLPFYFLAVHLDAGDEVGDLIHEKFFGHSLKAQVVQRERCEFAITGAGRLPAPRDEAEQYYV